MSRPARRSGPRRQRWPRALALAVAGGATLAASATVGACGSHPKALRRPPPPPATTTTTTTVAPTTTTTAPPPPVYPLTGLPATDPARRHRPALVVKIDNVSAALPQTGVGSADVVYEEMVEGGLTRLAAVFQSTDAAPLGPVRSGRTTDIGLVDDLDHPLFAFSGANPVFLGQIRASPIVDVDAERSPAPYYRGAVHAVPHNLYTSTTRLYALDPGAVNAPPPLFTYRAAGAAVAGAGARPAARATVAWPQASATWDWRAGPGQWVRSQDGRPDVDTTGYQLQAANVVVQAVTYDTAGLASGEGLPLEPIPAGRLVGSGPVWVFTGGAVVGGTWSRPSLAAATTYRDAAGRPIALSPGRTWVELIRAGTGPQIVP